MFDEVNRRATPLNLNRSKANHEYDVPFYQSPTMFLCAGWDNKGGEVRLNEKHEKTNIGL